MAFHYALKEVTFVKGYDEDGSPNVHHVLVMTRTAEDGRRWEHRTFGGVITLTDEDGGVYFDREKAEAIKAAAVDFADDNEDNWEEIEPCYGSPAYR